MGANASKITESREEVLSYSHTQLASKLREKGINDLADVLEENEVDGATALILQHADLEELGYNTNLKRSKILSVIKTVNEHTGGVSPRGGGGSGGTGVSVPGGMNRVCPKCTRTTDQTRHCGTTKTFLVLAADPPSPGDTLGDRYQLTQKLAEGGMGMVFLGRDLDVERDVAVKIIRTPPGPVDLVMLRDAICRMARELTVTAKFHHPNIMVLFGGDQRQDGLMYMLCEFVRGDNLTDIVATTRAQKGLSEGRAGGLDYQLVVEYMVALLEGLKHIHDKGYAHRDIKPDNLMVNEENILKIMDFGITKELDDANDNPTMAAQTAVGFINGTAPYLAPECFDNCTVTSTASRDLWAVAVTAFYLTTGCMPFAGNSLQQVHKSLQEPAPLQLLAEAGCPPAFVAVIERSLKYGVDARYANAQEMADAFSGSLLSDRGQEDDDQSTNTPPPAPIASGNMSSSLRGAVQEVMGQSGAARAAACISLRKLISSSSERVEVANSGVLSSLVDMLSGYEGEEAQREGAWMLRHVGYKCDAVKLQIGESGAIPRLVELCRNGSSDVKVKAGWALEGVFAGSGTAVNRDRGVEAGGVEAFMAMIDDPNQGVREQGVWCLRNVMKQSETCGRIPLRSGQGVNILTRLAKVNMNVDEQVAYIFEQMAKHGDLHSYIRDAGAVVILQAFEHGEKASEATKTYARNALISMGEHAEPASQSGAIGRALSTLRSGSAAEREKACITLRDALRSEDDRMNAMAGGALPPLIDLLRSGSPSAKTESAWTLRTLAYKCVPNKTTIGHSGVADMLVEMCRNGSNDEKTKAGWVLESLAVVSEIKLKIIACNAVSACVPMLLNPQEPVRTQGVWTIRNLCGDATAQRHILDEKALRHVVTAWEAVPAVAPQCALILDRCTDGHNDGIAMIREVASVLRPLVAEGKASSDDKLKSACNKIASRLG